MELKSRSVGHSNQVSGEIAEQQASEVENKDNPEHLKAWLEEFVRQYKTASFRKSRCESLMRRKIAKTWSPEKTAKMVRRLVTASKLVEQSENALDNISSRLARQGIEVDVASRSGVTSLSA